MAAAYSASASATAADPSADPSAGPSSTDSMGFDLSSLFNTDTVDMTNQNLTAFLDMVAVSEGTKGRGDDGYNIIVGGSSFDSYAAHPRIVVATRYGNSDAAGRYQIMAAVPGKITTNTWDWVSKYLGLTDFSPASQDAAASELIRRRGALSDIYAGNIASAITKCRKEWASLPGAGYGQGENSMASLLAAYQNAGGALA